MRIGFSLPQCGGTADQPASVIHFARDVNGAGGFADANPLQRVWRDVEVAGRHGIINPPIAQEVFGKVLVGAEKAIIWGE